MTFNDPERQNKGFRIFLRFWAATQVYIIHKVAPRNYVRHAIQIENLVFVY